MMKEEKKIVAHKNKSSTQKTNGKKVDLKALRRLAIVIAAILLFLGLLIWGLYHLILNYYLSKVNVVTEEELVFQTEKLTEEPITIDLSGELNEEDLPKICNNKNVKHFLFLATDNRGKGSAGRSDSMILVSVNSKTEKVVLCSFLRDIYAKYPKEPKSPVAGGYDKLTHAHAYGGPELTMAVLKETFNIEVNQYAKVDFFSFREIIDSMGGVDLYLTADEVYIINDILSWEDSANEALKVTQKDQITSKGDGMYHLTGVQALTHARNRTLGSDWARTQRQRELIEAMMKKASSLSLSQLNNLLNTVLPLITTNIPKNELKEVVGNVPSYLGYETESTRIPLQGLYHEEGSLIIPDLKENCTDLYDRIYKKTED
jgi:LCP family protein required for cell wall assembly